MRRRNIRHELARNVNAYERNYADAPAAVAPSSTLLGAAQGNPQFQAQFDLTIRPLYYSVAAGVYTPVLPAALPVDLRSVQLNAFIFGNSDYASGFAKLKSQFPVQGWTYDRPFVYGSGYAAINNVPLTATVTNSLVAGDLVITYNAVSGGTNYVALVVVRCTQVAYGTLLDAINSDTFVQNMIRYIIADNTQYAQYNNNIFVCKQSLFGKFDSDFVSPNSFKMPEQMQDGVIDIPLIKGIDKQIALATSVNPTVGQIQLSFFVATVQKLTV